MQAKKELDATNAEVERIEQLMAELNAKFETAKEERAVLQAETELMMKRLDAADRLINGLASENERSELVIMMICRARARFARFVMPVSVHLKKNT